MNNLQRERFISVLPKDEELHKLLNTHETIDTDKAVYDKIKTWVNWKIFFVAITALFYAIYYYAKNKGQASRNIFKAIPQTLKPLKSLKEEIAKANTKEEQKKKQEEEIIYDTLSEDNSAYKSPTATSAALKSQRPKKIEFEKNLLKCYRLRNGNFIVQLANFEIQILDQFGKKTKDLSPENKCEITAFSELADGTIVAGGKTLDSDVAILMLWNGKEKVEKLHPTINNVVTLDTLGNTIAVVANTKDDINIYIIEVSNNAFKQIGGPISCVNPVEKIMLMNNDQFVISVKNGGTQSYNFRTQHLFSITESLNHPARLPNQQIFSNDDPKKPHIQVRNAIDLSLILETDISDKHLSAISHVVTSPNGKYLATSDFDGMINLWDSESFAVLKSFDTDIFTIAYLSVNDNGEIAAAEGELENYDLKVQVAGESELTIPSIHFFNRPVNSLPSPRKEEIQEELQDKVQLSM